MTVLLTGFIAALVELGLAILGWGGFGPFFSHAPLIAVMILTLLMCVAALFTSVNLSTGEREDRSNRWVFIAFGILAFLLAYLPAYTDRIDFWTIDGDATRWLGVALSVLGGTLRMWPMFVLGRRFSGLVAIQPGHRLVTTGIYRHIRNPSYLGVLVGCVGWALAFRSATGLIITALLLIPLIARMRAEERLLGANFGAEYESYLARTWRLIPGVY